MDIKPNQYSRLVFWLKTSLVISAILLSSTIFIFSYSKKLNTEFSVITNDVRIGLKYQARNAHVKGNTDDGGVFDHHHYHLHH